MDFLNNSIFYYFFLLAIPVIIHLFNFRKHKNIHFSSIFFLKKLEEQTKSKYQIRRWIVLCNRILAVICIILVFGLPYINNPNNLSDVKKIGFYIDNSFSMERADRMQTPLIEHAKNNAKEIIKQLDKNQQVLILTNDFQKKHQKWYAPEDAIELINNINISASSDNLQTVISRYNKLIDTVNTNRLYVFSDFQKHLNTKKNINHQNTNLKIGVLNTEGNPNISIDSCYFENPVRKTNEIEKLTVIISNHGEDNQQIKVKLNINRQQKDSYNIEVPSHSTISQSFHYVNMIDEDTIKGVLEIEDNSMQFDDKLYFSYSTNEKLEVASIYENSASQSLLNVFSDSLFQFNAYNVNQIEYERLDEVKLIILDQLNNISNSLSKRLENYLHHGGNIFLFLHENIDVESYNHFLKNINTDIIYEWKKEKHMVKYINYQNNIFKDVFNEENDNINLPLVNGYFSMKKNRKSQTRKIFNFLNNDTFLAEYIYKKGRIFICTSDLNQVNNNFSNHALFLPCLYNASLMNMKKKKLYHTIHNETIIEATGINKSDVVNLEKEREFDMIASVINSNQRTLINFQDQIPYANNYNLIINQQKILPISFNYNRNESSMIFLTKDEIKNIFYNQNNIDFIKIQQNQILQKDQDNKKRKGIENFFIISAIILLIIEVILLRIWKM